jgi:AcrR family transcriptional regulator
MNSSRPYSSPVRAERAAETRDRIRDAAAELFVEDGYSATTVSRIASRSGVTAQTVFNVFGTKSALLKAVYDVTLVGDTADLPLAERPESRALQDETDPVQLLHGYARLGRILLDRVGALALQIAAGATAGDPELAELRDTIHAERLAGTTMLAQRLAELGALEADLTVAAAADRIWTLNSFEVWHLLTEVRGWSGDDYATWVGEAFCAAVLAPGRRVNPE